MFEEFASGGVEHQKSFWTTNKLQFLTEACKTVNLCRLHSLAETCITSWFSKGPNGFGGGNVVSDTFMKRLSSGEKRKLGRRMGAGVMEERLTVRKDQAEAGATGAEVQSPPLENGHC